jgi:hypothetical protein
VQASCCSLGALGKSVQVVWEELKMIEVQECDVELKELPKR